MLFAPILASTQPVFSIDEPEIIIPFSLSTVTSINEITWVEVLISQQTNNRSIINSGGYSTILSRFNSENLSVTIVPSENFDMNRWQAGNLYKVQMRFVKDSKASRQLSTEESEVSRSAQMSYVTTRPSNGSEYSEWSNVMIIKPITPPELVIRKDKNILSVFGHQLVSSLTPTFFGGCAMPEENKEIEEFYCFTIYQSETMLETTGWKKHQSETEDIGYFQTRLVNQGSYSITYEIKTHNGYTQITKPIDFIAVEFSGGDLNDVQVNAISNIENACIDITLLGTKEEQNLLTGNFVIARTSNKSDFTKFEDIKFLNYFDKNINEELIAFRDFSIESGVIYKYSFQLITSDLVRTSALLTNEIMINFESTYLCHGNVQLRLGFNNKISSFKHTTLRSKQDTIGDKYPHLIQNGNTYYAEFPITGTISYQDNIETFFYPSQEIGVYYQNKLVIEHEKFEPLGGKRLSPSSLSSPEVNYLISTNLTDNNIYIERKFREKVEEFLNNFDYKLFKSATEGNIIINLMNVSLTPNADLGRMVYDFSATAYEVLDNTIEEMALYGIIDRGEIIDLGEIAETSFHFGQLIYHPEDDSKDIFARIKAQEDVVIPNTDLQYNMEDIVKLWIEPYPIEALKQEVLQCSITFETEKINILNSQINTSGKIPVFFKIESQDAEPFYIVPNRIYTLGSPTNGILSIENSVYPIIINYICETSIVSAETISYVNMIVNDVKLDQIARFFSTPNTNILNLISQIIKNDLPSTVEEIEDGHWKDIDNTEYVFDGLEFITIESDIGVEFEIGASDLEYSTYKIGYNYIENENELQKAQFESNRIFFPNILAHSGHIVLKTPSYAIINFAYWLRTIKRVMENEL